MVYYIAAAMGKPLRDYKKACRMADHFDFLELDRIYRTVKRGGPRLSHVVTELIGRSAPKNVVPLFLPDTLIIRKAA